MVVVGAGVIGIEYASMFAALGTEVPSSKSATPCLSFRDPEIVEALQFHLRNLAVTFRFGEEVTTVDVGASGALTRLASGKQISAEAVIYSAGRQGQTDHLGPCQRRSRSRQPWKDFRRRPIPHQSRPHLRRRRRDWLSRTEHPRSNGAGQARGISRLRRADGRDARPAADRHLLNPRGVLRRRHRGRAHRGLNPLRGRHIPLPRARPRPDRRRHPRHAQAAGVHRRTHTCWACTSSVRMPPNSCTSARR